MISIIAMIIITLIAILATSFAEAATVSLSCAAAGTIVSEHGDRPGDVLDISSVVAGCKIVVMNSRWGNIIVTAPGTNFAITVTYSFFNVSCHAANVVACLDFQQQLGMTGTTPTYFSKINITNVRREFPDNSGSLPNSHDRVLVQFGAATSCIYDFIFSNNRFYSSGILPSVTSDYYVGMLFVTKTFIVYNFAAENNYIKVESIGGAYPLNFFNFFFSSNGLSVRGSLTARNFTAICETPTSGNVIAAAFMMMGGGGFAASSTSTLFANISGIDVAVGSAAALPSISGTTLSVGALYMDSLSSITSFPDFIVSNASVLVQNLHRSDINVAVVLGSGAYMTEVSRFNISSSSIKVKGSFSATGSTMTVGILSFRYLLVSTRLQNVAITGNTIELDPTGSTTSNAGTYAVNAVSLHTSSSYINSLLISGLGITVTNATMGRRFDLKILDPGTGVPVIHMPSIKIADARAVATGVRVVNQFVAYLLFASDVVQYAGSYTEIAVANCSLLADGVNATDTVLIGLHFDSDVTNVNRLAVSDSSFVVHNPASSTISGKVTLGVMHFAGTSSQPVGFDLISIRGTNVSLYQDQDAFTGSVDPSSRRQFGVAAVCFVDFKIGLGTGSAASYKLSLINNTLIVHANVTNSSTAGVVATNSGALQKVDSIEIDGLDMDVILETSPSSSSALDVSVLKIGGFIAGCKTFILANITSNFSGINRGNNTAAFHLFVTESQGFPSNKFQMSSNVMNVNLLRAANFATSVISLATFGARIANGYQLLLDSNTINLATTLSPTNDPSTSSWNKNLEVSSSSPMDRGFGAIECLDNSSSNPLVVYMIRFRGNVQNSNRFEINNSVINGADLLGHDAEEQQQSGMYRRRNLMFFVVAFDSTISSVGKIAMSNTFVSMNQKSSSKYTAAALYFADSISSISEIISVSGTTLVFNGTCDETSSAVSYLTAGLFATTLVTPMTMVDRIQFIDTNISIPQTLEAHLHQISVVDGSMRINTTNFIIDGVVININKIVSSSSQLRIFVFGVDGSSGKVLISDTLRVDNVFFQSLRNISVVGTGNICEVNLIDIALSAHPDRSVIRIIEVNNISGSIGSLAVDDGDLSVRLVNLLLSIGYQNISVSNVSLRIERLNCPARSVYLETVRVLKMLPNAALAADAYYNFYFGEMNITINNLGTGGNDENQILLALGDSSPSSKWLGSLIVENVTVKIANLSPLTYTARDSFACLVHFPLGIQEAKDGVTIRFSGVTFVVVGDGTSPSFAVYTLAFAGSDTHGIVSTAGSEPFLNFVDVAIENRVVRVGSNGDSSSRFIAAVLVTRSTAGFSDISFPHSDAGAINFRNASSMAIQMLDKNLFVGVPAGIVAVMMLCDGGVSNVSTITFENNAVHAEGHAGAEDSYGGLLVVNGATTGVITGGAAEILPMPTNNGTRLSGIFATGNKIHCDIRTRGDSTWSSLGCSVFSFADVVSDIQRIVISGTIMSASLSAGRGVVSRKIAVQQLGAQKGLANISNGIKISDSQTTVVANGQNDVMVAPIVLKTFQSGGPFAIQINNNAAATNPLNLNYGITIANNKLNITVGNIENDATWNGRPQRVYASLGIFSDDYSINDTYQVPITIESNELVYGNITAAVTHVSALLMKGGSIDNVYSVSVIHNVMNNLRVNIVRDTPGAQAALSANVSMVVLGNSIENVARSIQLVNNTIQDVFVISTFGDPAQTAWHPKIVALFLLPVAKDIGLRSFSDALPTGRLSLASNVLQRVFLLNSNDQASSAGTKPGNSNDVVGLARLWMPLAADQVKLAQNRVANCIANSFFWMLGRQDGVNRSRTTFVSNGGSVVNTTYIKISENALSTNCRYSANFTENNIDAAEAAKGPISSGLFSIPFEPSFVDPGTIYAPFAGSMTIELLSNEIREADNAHCVSLIASRPLIDRKWIANFSSNFGKQFSMVRILDRNADPDVDPFFFERVKHPLNVTLKVDSNVIEYGVRTGNTSFSSSSSSTSSTSASVWSLVQFDAQRNASILPRVPVFVLTNNSLRGNNVQGNVVSFVEIVNASAFGANKCNFNLSGNYMRQGRVVSQDDAEQSSLLLSPRYFDLQQSTFVFYCNDFTFDILKYFNKYMKPTTASSQFLCNRTMSVRTLTGTKSKSISRTDESESATYQLTRSTPSRSRTPDLSSSRTASTTSSRSLLPPPANSSRSRSSNSSSVSTSETPNTESKSHDDIITRTITRVVQAAQQIAIVQPVPATMTFIGSGIAVATGASIVGPLAIRNGLILGVLGCGQDPQPLDVGTHPTQINLKNGIGPVDGDDLYGEWRGVILGNFLLLIGGCVLLVSIPAVIRKTQCFATETKTKTRQERADQIARTTFNKLLIVYGVAWIVLAGPTTTGMTASLFYSKLGGSADNIAMFFLIVLVGPLISCAPMIVVCYACYQIGSCGIELEKVDENKEHQMMNKILASDPDDKNNNNKNIEPGSSTTSSSSTGLLQKPDDKSLLPPHQRHGACVGVLLKISSFLFASFRGVEWPLKNPLVKRWGFLFEHTKVLPVAYLEHVFGFLLNVTIGLAQGTSISRLRCQVLAVLILAFQVPMFCLIVFLGPMLSRFDQYVSASMYFANIVTAALVVAAVFRRNDDDAANSEPQDGALDGPIGNVSLAQGMLNIVASFAYLTYFVRLGAQKKLQKENEVEEDEVENNNNAQTNHDDDGDATTNNLYRFEDFLMQGNDDEFNEIIADVLGTENNDDQPPVESRQGMVDEDFARMIEVEMMESNNDNNKKTKDDTRIDLSMIFSDDDDFDERNNNNNNVAVVTPTRQKTNEEKKSMGAVRNVVDYHLDDDNIDSALAQYLLDEDDDDSESELRNREKRGLGAAKNEELEMRRMELLEMLDGSESNSFDVSNKAKPKKKNDI